MCSWKLFHVVYIKQFRNYDGFKFFKQCFLEFLQKEKNTLYTVIMKMLRILEFQLLQTFCQMAKVSLRLFS